MNNQSRAMISLLIMLGGIIAGLILDGYYNWVYGLQSTVSWLLWTNSYQHPIIVVIIVGPACLFAGHLWWSMRDYFPDDWKDKK